MQDAKAEYALHLNALERQRAAVGRTQEPKRTVRQTMPSSALRLTFNTPTNADRS